MKWVVTAIALSLICGGARADVVTAQIFTAYGPGAAGIPAVQNFTSTYVNNPDGSYSMDTGPLHQELLGAAGSASARIWSPNANTAPKIQVYTYATAPAAVGYNEDPSGYTSKASAVFDDQLTSTSPGMSSMAMQLQFHADMVSQLAGPITFNAMEHAEVNLAVDIRFGSAHVHKIFSRDGSYTDDGTYVAGTFDQVFDWVKGADFTVALPAVPAFPGTPLHLEVDAVVEAANDTADGPTLASIDSSHSLDILGIIPYDANGNVMPTDGISITGTSGFNYAVITPEPTSLSLLVATALALGRRARRSRADARMEARREGEGMSIRAQLPRWRVGLL